MTSAQVGEADVARMRTLKPEACTSETLAQVDRAVRWTFACLWTHCDDDGRAAYNPRLIKAAIYPLDDDVTPDVIADEIKELESIGALCLYEVDGKLYLHVPSWSEHQHPNRKVASKLPPCPMDEHSSTAHAQRSEDSLYEQGELSPVVVVGEGDVVGEGGAGGEDRAEIMPRQRGIRLPEDWQPDDGLWSWTLEQGLSEEHALRELDKFRDYWVAQPGQRGVKLNWVATWRNWVRKALEQHPVLRRVDSHAAFLGSDAQRLGAIARANHTEQR